MKKTELSAAQAGPGQEELPARVQEALGDLVTAAREGLLALSVDVGLGVLAELMEEEVVEVVGAKGKHDPDRVAVRHGHESGEVTLGGGRVGVARPRVRSADGASELPLATYRHFADRDSLARVVLERMLAGVSCRRYRRIQEPVGREVERRARSISKSSISRAFVERTRKALGEPPPGRRSPGGADAGRDRAERPHEHRLPGDHDRGRKDPVGSGRARPRTRPSRPLCCRTWSSVGLILSRGCCS
jgi:hypothetical protein